MSDFVLFEIDVRSVKAARDVLNGELARCPDIRVYIRNDGTVGIAYPHLEIDLRSVQAARELFNEELSRCPNVHMYVRDDGTVGLRLIVERDI